MRACNFYDIIDGKVVQSLGEGGNMKNLTLASITQSESFILTSAVNPQNNIETD